MILFSDPAGFVKGEPVNTFRVGDKWAKALRVGETVQLARTEDEKVVGEAEVTGIFLGSWDEAKRLAPDNHSASRFGALAAADMLLAELKRHYDKVEGQKISVIYLNLK